MPVYKLTLLSTCNQKQNQYDMFQNEVNASQKWVCILSAHIYLDAS